MLSLRRKTSVSKKGGPPPESSPAALQAASTAFHPHHINAPPSLVSAAAATAALRSASTRSPSPSQITGSIPTKRMVRRKGSYSSRPSSQAGSTSGEHPRQATLRKPRSGSLRERTFRSSVGSLHSERSFDQNGSDASSFTKASVPKRSASVQDRRRPSSPTPPVKTGEIAIDEEAEFADTEENDGNRRRFSTSSKNSHPMHNTNEEIPRRSDSITDRHPQRISEEIERDYSHAGAMKAAAWAKQHPKTVVLPNENDEWGFSAKNAEKEAVGDIKLSGTEGTQQTDRMLSQVGKKRIVEKSDEAIFNAAARASEKLHHIYTTPKVEREDKSVVGTDSKRSSMRLDTSIAENPPSPKPRSPSKTTFPRGHEGHDLSAAPPVPPLPPIATLSQGPENFERRLNSRRGRESHSSGLQTPRRSTSLGSSNVTSPPRSPRQPPTPSIVGPVSPPKSLQSSRTSQETLSSYITPKSSFHKEPQLPEMVDTPVNDHQYHHDKQDKGHQSGVLDAVQNTFTMFARGFMPGRFPSTSSASKTLSNKSSTETLTNEQISHTRTPTSISPPATPVTTHKVVDLMEVTTVSQKGGTTDAENADLVSIAGDSIYESACEYQSDGEEEAAPVIGRTGVHFAPEFTAYSPQHEDVPRRWSSDSDSDDTVNDAETTRHPVPPRAPTPPTTNSSFAGIANIPSSRFAVDFDDDHSSSGRPPPPLRRHSPPATPVKLKPILKPSPQPSPVTSMSPIHPESPTLQRKASSSSESSVQSVSSYRRINTRESKPFRAADGSLTMRQTLRGRAINQGPEPINTTNLPPNRMGSRKLRKEPMPAANGVHLLASLREDHSISHQQPASKPTRKHSIFHRFTSDNNKKHSETSAGKTEESGSVSMIPSPSSPSDAPPQADDTATISPIQSITSSAPSSSSKNQRQRPLSSLSFQTLRGNKDKEDRTKQQHTPESRIHPTGDGVNDTHDTPLRKGTLRGKRRSQNLDAEVLAATTAGDAPITSDGVENGVDGVKGESGGAYKGRKKGFWSKVFKRKG